MQRATVTTNYRQSYSQLSRSVTAGLTEIPRGRAKLGREHYRTSQRSYYRPQLVYQNRLGFHKTLVRVRPYDDSTGSVPVGFDRPFRANMAAIPPGSLVIIRRVRSIAEPLENSLPTGSAFTAVSTFGQS